MGVDLMQIEGKIPEMPKVEISCKDCGHIGVCAVFRAVGPLLSKWEEESRPFEPERMAAICRHWVSAKVLNTLQGDNR